MYQFEVETDRNFLGNVRIGAGDNRLYEADFGDLLDRGTIIVSSTAGVTSSVSTVTTPTLTPNEKGVRFYVQANSASEQFTLLLQIVDNNGQTLNFSANYTVYTSPMVAPLLGPAPAIIGPTGPTGATGPTGPGVISGSVGSSTNVSFIVPGLFGGTFSFALAGNGAASAAGTTNTWNGGFAFQTACDGVVANSQSTNNAVQITSVSKTGFLAKSATTIAIYYLAWGR